MVSLFGQLINLVNDGCWLLVNGFFLDSGSFSWEPPIVYILANIIDLLLLTCGAMVLQDKICYDGSPYLQCSPLMLDVEPQCIAMMRHYSREIIPYPRIVIVSAITLQP